MERVVPVRHYLVVCVTLLSLTLATMAVAYVDLGHLNTAVAMVIAAFKTLLVVVFFMHVRRKRLLVVVHATAGLLLLAALIALSVADRMTRG